MNAEDLATMQCDWKRLQGTPGGLKILAQLHDCTEQDAAELLGIPCRKQKKADGRTGNTRRRYSKNLKRTVTEEVLSGRLPAKEAAKRHNIPWATVQGWVYTAKGRKEGGKWEESTRT